MNRHYDNYLTKKYAPLYRERHADMRTTCMCWGFCVGDGWFNIINQLSAQLCQGWLRAKYDYDQIKDRLGLLKWSDDSQESAWNVRVTQEMIDDAESKMHDESWKVPVARQVKEKMGTLRFYLSGGTDEHHAAVTLAERMSSCTCEKCGKPGKMRNLDGYYTVRCNEHATRESF